MDDKFFASLGRFIYQFSAAESLTLQCLWKLTELRLDVAKALFGSSRVEAAIDAIRNIHKAQQLQMDPDVDRALKQLQSINTLRNLIVHQGISAAEGFGYWTGKSALAKSFEESFDIPLSGDDLEKATHDLTVIHHALMIRVLPLEGQPFYPHLLETSRAPWRYKFPQPIPASGRGPVSERSLRQRRASQA